VGATLRPAHLLLFHEAFADNIVHSRLHERRGYGLLVSVAVPIEAVDDYFVAALHELESATQLERDALSELTDLYLARTGMRPHIDKSNALVLHAFRDKLGEGLHDRLLMLLQARSFIPTLIKTRYDFQYIFRQPWTLLTYLMVDSEPFVTARKWPLTSEELKPIYTDLGKSFPN
jgi:putative GTP pyrophosphokinase